MHSIDILCAFLLWNCMVSRIHPSSSDLFQKRFMTVYPRVFRFDDRDWNKQAYDGRTYRLHAECVASGFAISPSDSRRAESEHAGMYDYKRVNKF
jgi:hypothetical protein